MHRTLSLLWKNCLRSIDPQIQEIPSSLVKEYSEALHSMVFIKFFFPKFAGKTTTFQTFSQKLLATQPFLHCRPFLVIALSPHLSFSGLYSVTPLRNTNICAFSLGTSSWELPPELQAQIQALHFQHLQKTTLCCWIPLLMALPKPETTVCNKSEVLP